MKKIYLIPAVPFIIGIACFAAYSIIGSHVASDGTLIESFGLIPLGWLFTVIGIISAVILGIWFWFHKKLNTIQKVITVLASVLLVAFIGWVVSGVSSNHVDNVIKAIKTTTTETVAVKDATYLIDGESITLVNGLSEINIFDSTSKQITRYFGNEAIGDLNDDGKEDMAFILTQDNGGSGTFYYVAVALANDNGYQGLNTILLGDRIAPQTTKISDGKINVNYADRELDESFDIKPSVGVSKYFQVIGNKLTEINVTSQITGRAWKWVHTKMNNDEIITPKKSDAFSINFKDDGNLNGTTDCNNFFGKYEISGNKLSFGALGSTLMFCDGSQENVFTKSLSEIESYFIDENNNLVLQLKMDTGSMIFN